MSQNLSSAAVVIGTLRVNSKYLIILLQLFNFVSNFFKSPNSEIWQKFLKTPNFCGRQQFYSYFQNPSENSAVKHQITLQLVKSVFSGHSKIDKTKVLKTNGSLMKV